MTHDDLQRNIVMTIALGLITYVAISSMWPHKAKGQESLDIRRQNIERRLDDLNAVTTPADRDAQSADHKLRSIEKAIGDAEKEGRPLDRERIGRELRAAERLDVRSRNHNGSANPRVIVIDPNGNRVIPRALSGTTYVPGVGFSHREYD